MIAATDEPRRARASKRPGVPPAHGPVEQKAGP